ncbi:hypothetical protein FE257_003907 [Aspergillus nanangensis]|uniref:Aminoglycoside phosphotransferase domain-containing protein n=1 Tax=Aspergillus nanangensis TaxID=2582783 RepID=A0AAD4CRX1_ASPNN|nr:hypothetical protein FE257_003907 [Aspergillus nanangensis]
MAASAEQHNSLLIDKAKAELWNRDLMEAFRQALQKDPAVDLLSVVGRRYIHAHHVAQRAALSESSQLNVETAYYLENQAFSRPGINLRDAFPLDYDRQLRWAKSGEKEIAEPVDIPPPMPQPEKPCEWLHQKIEPAKTASIIYPLSSQVSGLFNSLEETSLATSLKNLILKSDTISELRIRTGAILKCSDHIVIKIFPSGQDLTEYHNLQYLAESVPDLPIPKPHGLILLGPIGAMFMSYVPGITLKEVWSDLSHEGKQSIQKELDNIFSRLRNLRQEDGPQLGGVREEGVKDFRIMDGLAYKGITSARAFDQLQFSAEHRASPCYVQLLRSFLTEDNKSLHGSVFTHADLKKSNIMVQEDPSRAGFYIVTGVIDWEDSGFYPEYYECTTLSDGQSIDFDDDWYLYTPPCISPLQFPVRWLVDRLWGNLLWSWRTDIVR